MGMQLAIPQGGQLRDLRQDGELDLVGPSTLEALQHIRLKNRKRPNSTGVRLSKERM